MNGHAPARLPWLWPAVALSLAGLLAYFLFGVYFPSQQQLTRLEAEVRDVYRREADLQLQLAEARERELALRKQMSALTNGREPSLKTREPNSPKNSGKKNSGTKSSGKKRTGSS